VTVLMTLDYLSRDDNPQLGAIEALGYETVAALSVRPASQVYRVRRGDDDDIMKFWRRSDGRRLPNPVKNHRLLPLMDGVYSRLVLPSYRSDGFDEKAGHYVVMGYIRGTEFRGRWHQYKPRIAGGRGLSHATIDLIVDLVRDLAAIPAEDLVDAGLKTVTREALRSLLEQQLVPLARDSLLDDPQVDRGRGLAMEWAQSLSEPGRLFVSNTDFRILNLIEVSADRTALIDWDAARASGFEREHCIAYQWVFLWNTPELQSALVHAARDRLDIDRETFRVLLLTRAAAQARIYDAKPDLRRLQAQQVVDVLDDSAFARIWS
jgi:hypothetical protein